MLRSLTFSIVGVAGLAMLASLSGQADFGTLPVAPAHAAKYQPAMAIPSVQVRQARNDGLGATGLPTAAPTTCPRCS